MLKSEKQSIVSAENQSSSRMARESERDRALLINMKEGSDERRVASSEVAFLNQFSIIAEPKIARASEREPVINYSFLIHTEMNKSRERRSPRISIAIVNFALHLIGGCQNAMRRLRFYLFNSLVTQQCNKLQHKCIIEKLSRALSV
jgi:hypothetical protein